jgi:hypothetical protein
MSEPAPSFFPRLFLATRVFLRIVFDGRFAARVMMLGGSIQPEPTRPVFREAPPDAALQLLGLLQQSGRFVDFLQEDVSGFSDAEVGAAARVVHEGCSTVVREHFTIAPIRDEPEGARVTLREGFNASSVRLTGNVVGNPPFTGALIHRGWRVTQAKLPKVAEGHDTSILAAAEVEL